MAAVALQALLVLHPGRAAGRVKLLHHMVAEVLKLVAYHHMALQGVLLNLGACHTGRQLVDRRMVEFQVRHLAVQERLGSPQELGELKDMPHQVLPHHQVVASCHHQPVQLVA